MARDYAPKTLNGIVTAVAKDLYKKMGNTIAKDMTSQYASSIRAFYEDYTPHKYRRKYRGYYYADENGVKAYTKFVKMDSDGKGFTVCLKVDPMNIRTPYTSIVNGKGSMEINEMVFFNTWVLGQHGGRLPWSAIPRDKRAAHPNANNWKAINGDFYWEPPVMEMSPMDMMIEWFVNYTNPDNLQKMSANIVWSSIERYLRRWKVRYGERI